MRLLLASLIVVLSAGSTAAQETRATEKEESLGPIEGTWYRVFKDEDGTEVRHEKRIKGRREIFSVYRGGELQHRHSAQLDIERAGKVRVVTVPRIEITDGKQAGQVLEGPFAYIFRIRGDRWIEAHGLLEEDDQEPLLVIYERAPAEREG